MVQQLFWDRRASAKLQPRNEDDGPATWPFCRTTWICDGTLVSGKTKGERRTHEAESAADLSTKLSSFSPRSSTPSIVLCCKTRPHQLSRPAASRGAKSLTKMILVSSSSCCTRMIVSACFGSWYLTI